jgi:hypothetical protein
MTAGTTSLETMRAFLAAKHDFRLAEIGLHPGIVPDAAASSPDGWHDPLAQLRPHELELLVSAELEELLAASGCRLGRLDPDNP